MNGGLVDVAVGRGFYMSGSISESLFYIKNHLLLVLLVQLEQIL